MAVGLLAMPAVASAATAPAIDARTLSGDIIRVPNHDGAVVIVNFWATWCAPCRAEMPAIDRYYRDHRDDGLRVIAISMDQGREREVRAIAATLHFDVALGRASRIASTYRPSALPATLVFGRDGQLRYDSRRLAKSAPLDASELARIVDPLLGERRP
jgi:thiol-disulfide isomerase/thioredoxin